MYQVTIPRHRFLLQGSLIVVVMLFLALALPCSISATEHSLEILGEAITVQPDKENDNRMVTTITVRNNGTEVNNLAIRAVTEDGKDIQVVVNQGGTSIAGYSVAQFEIEFPEAVEKTVAGHLIIEVEDVVPAVQSLTLEPAADDAASDFLGIATLDASRIITISFWFGFVLLFVTTVIAILVKLRPKKFWLARIKDLEWEFEQNWASTFVLLGGVLNTLVGSEIMPEESQILSAEGFQTLNTLFPILIVVAPFVLAALNALGKEPKDADAAKKTPLLILPFVTGSAIVVWALTGELAALAVLFKELQIAGHVSAGVAQFFQIFLFILWLLGLYYAWEKVVQISLTAKMSSELDLWQEDQVPSTYLP